MMIGSEMSYNVRKYFECLNALQTPKLISQWNSAAEALVAHWESRSLVFIAGNGGNFLNALHFATDWTKGLHAFTGRSLPSIVAGENVGLASAIENDWGHENAIVDYLKSSGLNFKAIVLLSAGGTSQNILNAAAFARQVGIQSIGLLGGTRHDNSKLFDYPIHIESDDIQLVEDFHSMFGHTVLKAILSQLSNSL